MTTPSKEEALEIDDATLLANLKHFAELCGDDRKRNKFRHMTLAVVLKAAHDRLATLPPQHSSGDVRELLTRLRCHAGGLRENARYHPQGPSGLTNADAVSYALLIEEAAAAIEAALSRQDRPEGVGELYERARPLIEATHRKNLPLEIEPGKRLVGFVLPEDVAGLSEGLFMLEALQKLAALASRSAPDGWVLPCAFPYQRTFNAIAAATSISGSNIAISVRKFQETFNAASPSALSGEGVE